MARAQVGEGSVDKEGGLASRFPEPLPASSWWVFSPARLPPIFIIHHQVFFNLKRPQKT